MIAITDLNFFVALGTIGMQLSSVALLVLYFLREKSEDLKTLSRIASKFALVAAFLITLVGTIVSLYYSSAYGLIPCWLCWFQRVFLFPQVIILGIALWKKDVNATLYGIALSFFGAAISLYQHYLQMGGESIAPCPIDPALGDCAQRFLFEFGYITFPLVAFSTFALLIVLMLFVRKNSTTV